MTPPPPPPQLAQALGPDLRGLGRVDEADDGLDELARPVELGKMAGARDLEVVTPGHFCVRPPPMLDRNDVVALAPDDQGRQFCRQVEAVPCAHPLSSRFDHRSQRLDERLSGFNVPERPIAAGEFAEVRARLQPETAQKSADRGSRAQQTWLDEDGQHELGSGEGGRTQQEMHLSPETATRHEPEPLDALRELVRELHRYPTPQRVPDERRSLVAEDDHQVPDPACVGAQRVVAPRLRRLAVPEQIRREHGDSLREPREHLAPGVRGGGDAVHENQHRALAAGEVAHSVPVQGDLS